MPTNVRFSSTGAEQVRSDAVEMNSSIESVTNAMASGAGAAGSLREVVEGGIGEFATVGTAVLSANLLGREGEEFDAGEIGREAVTSATQTGLVIGTQSLFQAAGTAIMPGVGTVIGAIIGTIIGFVISMLAETKIGELWDRVFGLESDQAERERTELEMKVEQNQEQFRRNGLRSLRGLSGVRV